MTSPTIEAFLGCYAELPRCHAEYSTCRRQPEPCRPAAPRKARPSSAASPQASSLKPKAASRGVDPRGLTLIEMLIALAVTLVMMAAVVNLFANISASIRNRRAVIEVSGQLRQVRQRLALDLAGATCDATTWQRPSENRGYIEIIEGEWSDSVPTALTLDPATSLVPRNNLVLDYMPDDNNNGILDSGEGDGVIDAEDEAEHFNRPQSFAPGALGDWDDILALTVRNELEPFVARVGNDTVESTLAEVIWYAGENGLGGANGEPGMRRIYRRVYLIAPSLGPWNVSDKPANISVRFVPANSITSEPDRWVANTLGDLTKREYRVARNNSSSFPHLLDNTNLSADAEFLVMNDALAFDIRVYDPGAPLYSAAGNNVVQPGDPGWPAALAVSGTGSGTNPTGYGAYCDLGWNWNQATNLPYPAGAPLPNPLPFELPHRAGWHPTFGGVAPQPLVGHPCVYDTWSYHYENDGVGQDFILANEYSSETPPPQFAPWAADTVDQGANGFDDDDNFGVDDMGERETAPPYDVPLKSLQVRLRIYERDSRQIRETSVTHSF